MTSKTRRQLETENAALRERVARLEGEVAGLRVVKEALAGLVAPSVTLPPTVAPVVLPFEPCVHDFPSHQVGPVFCGKCGLRALPIGETAYVDLTAPITIDVNGSGAHWLETLGRPLTEAERLRVTGCAPSLLGLGGVVAHTTLNVGGPPGMNAVDWSQRYGARSPAS
jgi:hypothetical protein